MTVEQRFWSKTSPDNECLVWTASLDKDGYGRFQLEGKARRAHRVAYELTVGPIGDGLTIDHLCGNRSCVKPTHLDAVDIGTNCRRSDRANAGKPACKRGHLFTPENTRHYNGERICKTCQSARYKRWYDTKRKGL